MTLSKLSVVCLQIVADAEAWLGKLKRVLASSPSQSQQQSTSSSTGNAAVKAGSSLSRLRDLLAEGRRVPVNLEYEMRPLKASIEAAQEWMEQHSEVLKALGIVTVNNACPPADTAAAAMGGTNTDTKTKIPYEKLFSCVNAASGISATFPELSEVRELLRETDEWLALATERCERPQSHKKAAGHKSADQAAMTTSHEEEKVVNTTSTSSSSSSAPHRDVLLSLLARGQNLGVDVSAETEMIEVALAAIDDWEGTAGQALCDLDRQVAPVVQAYRRLAAVTATVKGKTTGGGGGEAATSQLPPLPFPSFEVVSSSNTENDDGDGDGNDDTDDLSKTNAVGDSSEGSIDANKQSDKNKHEDKPKGKPKNSLKDRDEREAFAAAARRCVEEEAIQWGKFVAFYVEVQRMQREARELGVALGGSKGTVDDHGQAVSTNTSFVTLELSAAALYWIYSVRKLLLYPSTSPPDDPRLITNAPPASSSSSSGHLKNASGGLGLGAKGKGESAGGAWSVRPSKKKDKKVAVTAATGEKESAVSGVSSSVDAASKKTEDSSSSSSSSDHKNKDKDNDKDGAGGGSGDVAVAPASTTTESPRVAAAVAIKGIRIGKGGKGGVVSSDLGFGDVPLDLIQMLIRDAETYFEKIDGAAANTQVPSAVDGGVNMVVVNGLDHSSSSTGVYVDQRLAAMEAIYAASALANTPPPPPLKEEVAGADDSLGVAVAEADDDIAAEDGGTVAARKRRKVDMLGGQDDIEGGQDDGDEQDDIDGGGDDTLTATMMTVTETEAETDCGAGNDNSGKRKKRALVTTRGDDSADSSSNVEVRSAAAVSSHCLTWPGLTRPTIYLNFPTLIILPLL